LSHGGQEVARGVFPRLSASSQGIVQALLRLVAGTRSVEELLSKIGLDALAVAIVSAEKSVSARGNVRYRSL